MCAIWACCWWARSIAGGRATASLASPPASALARIIGGPLAFACLAFLHLVVGAIALALIVRRMKRVQLMHETKHEVSRSVDALTTTARSH